jgi:FKBP-type peptidyl-prolyl cis-trans isomerase
MRHYLISTTFAFFALLAAVEAQENLPQNGPATQPQNRQPAPNGNAPAQTDLYRQQVSYALGRNFAQNLSAAEIEYDLNTLVAGINDVLSKSQPKWTDEQLQAVLERFEKEMQQKALAKTQRQASKNAQEAAAFLAQNAKRDGIQTTPSGLQYLVLRQGNGPSPTRSDVVRCHYRGTLLNGTEFDSSANQGGPVEFPVARVIPGWTEALQKMHVGDKWQLFIPPKLAYEMNPPGPPIEANSLLVFEIELLEIVPQQ